MKVELKIIDDVEEYGWSELEVHVDGQRISIGSFGGEPEDNSRHRHYGWVVPALEKLAKALGAEVETTITEDSEER